MRIARVVTYLPITYPPIEFFSRATLDAFGDQQRYCHRRRPRSSSSNGLITDVSRWIHCPYRRRRTVIRDVSRWFHLYQGRWRKCCWVLMLASSCAVEYVLFVPGSCSVSLELISLERGRKAGQERDKETRKEGRELGRRLLLLCFLRRRIRSRVIITTIIICYFLGCCSSMGG